VVTENPDWTEDEVILACDLVEQNGWRALSRTDPRVMELSNLLIKLPIHPADQRLPDFRNANGVRRKTADIASAHPDYPGTATHGGKTDRLVLGRFLTQPDLMHAKALALRAGTQSGEFSGLTTPAEDEDDYADEGRLLVRRHVARERNRKLRKRKIEALIQSGNPLACEVCHLDFSKFYGQRGDGYIECHHLLPLHMTLARRNSLKDLALLCANCHRMIHRSPWLSPEELRAVIEQAKTAHASPDG
jgi:5-methylcytosine-specific restriction protein A